MDALFHLDELKDEDSSAARPHQLRRRAPARRVRERHSHRVQSGVLLAARPRAARRMAACERYRGASPAGLRHRRRRPPERTLARRARSGRRGRARDLVADEVPALRRGGGRLGGVPGPAAGRQGGGRRPRGGDGDVASRFVLEQPHVAGVIVGARLGRARTSPTRSRCSRSRSPTPTARRSTPHSQASSPSPATAATSTAGLRS
jgi:hypothetical protein